MPTDAEITRAANRRRTVLRLIRTAISSNGYPPSVSELATRTGVTKRTVRLDLESLQRDGKIERDPGVTRGIRLVSPNR